MKKNLIKISLFFGMALMILPFTTVYGQSGEPVLITIETGFGNIVVELFTHNAPVTSANFIRYVKLSGTEGGEFYRTVTPHNQPDNKVKIEVIQGGFNLGKLDTGLIQSVPLERTNITGIFHRDGTISMARDDPDSGSTEFFICIGDQPSLDFGGARNPDGQGFAAFGRVISGMEIVRKIQSSSAEGQVLNPPVKILKFYM